MANYTYVSLDEQHQPHFFCLVFRRKSLFHGFGDLSDQIKKLGMFLGSFMKVNTVSLSLTHARVRCEEQVQQQERHRESTQPFLHKLLSERCGPTRQPSCEINIQQSSSYSNGWKLTLSENVSNEHCLDASL